MPESAGNCAATAAPIPREGLLGPSVRRDIRDLNGQFLELGLASDLSDDPRFSFSATIRSLLAGLDTSGRNTMTSSPFSLFHLCLPPRGCSAAAVADHVQDALAPDSVAAQALPTYSFGHNVLSVARRLAESNPLSLRLCFGLTRRSEARLVEMRLAGLSALAGWPGLIRPRWSDRPRVWAMLAEASAADSSVAAKRAYSVGMCMIGADISDRVCRAERESMSRSRR